MASLKLYLLGVPRIELDEQLVTVQRRKALALLFYLAINGKSQSRDTLATLLWPDNNQKQARLALNRHLFELREQLGGDWLESDHQTIGLRADADLWLDVDLFQRHLATCADAIPTCRAPLTQAVSLYRADFLTGFTLLDCPEFDEWQFFQSEGLRQQYAAALERLIQIQQDQDDYDNLEHLVDSSEVISRLLSGTQGVKALVTSRKRLNLQEEWLFSLSGLALALEPGGPAQPQAGITEAMQLFQQVALRVQPTFDLNASFNAVEQICRLVEGMPLGIELAASWARHLSPAAIVQEVENDIDFLATNVRNLPARHRSLRAVFDHSWRLLSALEQAVLPQLAVFRGGFRRTEAQAIAGASLFTLAALVDKSLLSVSITGRYGLHERLRQYLLEKLRQDVEVYQTTRDRHSQVYLSLLHIDPADLTKKAVLDLITADIDNIHSAWNWALDHAQWSAIRRSRSGLGWFYFHKGWLLASNDLFAQAVSTLKQRLAGPATISEPATVVEMQCLLAALQCYHCEVQFRLGLQNPDAKAIVQESLAILRAVDPPAPRELADCLLTAGQSLARRITVDHTAERHYLLMPVATRPSCSQATWLKTGVIR